jgi:periplasmic glucans biosynthesis protein
MINPTRRSALSMLAVMAAMGLRPVMSQTSSEALAEVAGMTLGAPTPFEPVFIALRARAMASKPFEAPPQVSQGWLDLTFDQFRGIWFDTRHTLFRGTKGCTFRRKLL